MLINKRVHAAAEIHSRKNVLLLLMFFADKMSKTPKIKAFCRDL